MYVIACIPAFNEGNKIKQVVKECMKYVDSVVVCDDHSADNTFDEAESAGAYVIKHEENKGKGAALKSLFRFARWCILLLNSGAAQVEAHHQCDHVS